MTTLDRYLARVARQFADLERRLSRVVVRARIVSVDHAAGTARVAVHEDDTAVEIEADVRWAAIPTDWDPPAEGVQAVVLCPGGELAAGWIAGLAYDDAHPAPSAVPTERRWAHADGAVIAYDAEIHRLTATLPEDGAIEATAPGGVTVAGDVTVTGAVRVDGDLTATGGVTGDEISDATGPVSRLRSQYNRHTHAPPLGGPPFPPTQDPALPAPPAGG